MSQTFFSKLTLEEKNSRLALLGSSGSEVTLWIKGQSNKLKFNSSDFHKDRCEIVLDSKEPTFPPGTVILCSFELRGMFFFSEVIFQTSLSEYSVLQFTSDVFKSEKRSSYRLMTFPMHNITADFDIGEIEEDGKVIDLQRKMSQTALFKNFLKMVETREDGSSLIRLRLQDLSTTGMGIHVGEIESKYFVKDKIFKDVVINFEDEIVIIPEIKIVYVFDFISPDKGIRKFKLGIQFSNLPLALDEKLGGKINKLLRNSNSSKDFENFVK